MMLAGHVQKTIIIKEPKNSNTMTSPRPHTRDLVEIQQKRVAAKLVGVPRRHDLCGFVSADWLRERLYE